MDLESLIGGGLTLLGGVAKRAPFAGDVLPLLADAERALVRVARRHLSDLDPPAVTAAPDDDPASPNAVLRALLDRSMYTSPDKSRDALYLDLLNALVPDEARILAALSDGSAYPVVHIAEPGAGGTPVFALKNASTIGRSAGVSLPRYTPLYLTRMLRLGLVRLGPEASSMNDEYEMLLTDSAVNIAVATARRGVRAARVVRRTVRISDLGQELWEAAK
ncbi:Abi-alpha family protein [Mycolicibacterium bacteremicum]|uniref:Abi-alpha family protein n=1 Tax=Mycolicibacterium bacteremicum TaxID=564198 RepID=UPI0026F12A03|nr:Abi-alpha family protein [Mycolicibacterium bacteremicum]